MKFVYDDGGRAAAGRRGSKSYNEAYDKAASLLEAAMAV